MREHALPDQKSYLPLLISGGLHGLLLVLLALHLPASNQEITTFTAPQAMQVRSLSPKDMSKELREALDETSGEQQIVQTDERLKSAEAPTTKEKVFLSKTHQSVDHNTRAARMGKFKNVLEEGVRGEQGSKAAETAEAKMSEHMSKLFSLTPNPKDLEPVAALTQKTGRLRAPASVSPTAAGGNPKGEGFSATDDYLQDIAVGANTLLNAREFKYYGFYERIRSKLTDHWQNRLNRVFQDLFAKNQNLLEGERITKVQIELTPDGQLKKVRLLGSSGVREFDQAATEAFTAAAPFPNPPAEMLDKDKSVRIRWDFVVLASADQGVKVNIQRDGF